MTTPSAPSGVANRLQAALNDANLHIPVTRTQLKSHRFESLEDFTPSNGNLSDPAVVASVVAQQIVRRLATLPFVVSSYSSSCSHFCES